MDWDTVRCFIAVAEAGSQTAAGAGLGLSPATLGRKIDALETALGLRLFYRGPSGASLTPEGIEILALARAGGEHLAQLERRAFALRAGMPATPVRVSATEPMIAQVLAPRLAALRQHDARLQVDLMVSVETVNLHRRDADLAVRMSRPLGETLVTRRLPAVRQRLYAAPAYLGGRDPAAVDLHAADLLMFNSRYGDIPEVRWLADNELGARVVMQTSSTLALLEATCAGAGIALLPDFLAGPRGLVAVAGPRVPPRIPWLVFHKDMRHVPAVKTVRTWIAACCRAAFAAPQAA